MKQLITLLFLLIFMSCKEEEKKSTEKVDKIIESYNAKKFADSSLQALREQTVMDTSGLYMSPIKVIEYSVVESASGSYRNIKAKYKNVSTKRVAAIRFKWYCLNAFGEPADLGVLSNGIGAGESDTPLKAGASESGIWETLSKDLKTIKVLYPYEVVFDDGEKWELKK